MHILVSNDDGIFASGIKALTEAVIPLADKVTVIAPSQNQSASGHKRTLNDPMRIRKVSDFVDGVEAYAVTGSPADCTAVAMLGFIKDPIDLVVSGINRGPNVAQDVTYSGTVAVALEALIFGLPAIAFSLDDRSSKADYQPSIPVARTVTETVIREGLPKQTLLNVNIPAGNEIKGYKTVKQGVRTYQDQLIERHDPHGVPYYWVGGAMPAGEVEKEGTDLWAVHNGYVSLTPIHLDLTAHDAIDNIAKWDINT